MAESAPDPRDALKATRRLVAFLGRYGGFDPGWCESQPIPKLIAYGHSVGELLHEESEAMKGERD